MSQRFLIPYEKLADSLNVRNDLKLARVNCDEHKDFCIAKNVNGTACQL